MVVVGFGGAVFGELREVGVIVLSSYFFCLLCSLFVDFMFGLALCCLLLALWVCWSGAGLVSIKGNVFDIPR